MPLYYRYPSLYDFLIVLLQLIKVYQEVRVALLTKQIFEFATTCPHSILNEYLD